MTVIDGKRTYETMEQDQTTPPVNYFMTRQLEALTLASSTIPDDPDITVEAGHSIAPGNMINIREGAHICQSEVVAVNVNDITLDQPAPCIFTVGASIERATKQMAVDGSVTTQTYSQTPPPLVKWDVIGFSVHIVDNLELDDTKFGGLAALTNGVAMRISTASGYFNLGVAKTNGDLFLLLSEGQYSDKAGGGGYAGFWSGLIRERLGVTARISGANNDAIQVLVQDDISDLTTMEIVVQGHTVLE